jgi:glucosamine--fructose-6-phosphate aminotransferase (isomerizing)
MTLEDGEVVTLGPEGVTVVALTNAVGSQATREADGVLFTRAGLEIGVAATKTSVAQVALLYELALRLAAERGALAPLRVAELQAALARAPALLDEIVGDLDGPIRSIAEELAWCPSSCTWAASPVSRSHSRGR